MGSEYRYGFNGKENDNSTGEGNLDFGARIYDNRLGRWLGVDKFTDKYPNVSPYAFCINSPLQFKDANGNWLIDKNGNIIYTRGATVYEIIDNVVYEAEKFYFYTNDGQAVETLVYRGKTPVTNVFFKDNIVSASNVLGIVDIGKSVTIKKGESLAYNCHGNSLNIPLDPDFDFLIIGKDDWNCDNVSKIYKNKAEFTPVNANDVQPGDIAIFDDGKGNIAHSATVTMYEEGGIIVGLTSKDDRNPVEHNMSIERIIKSNEAYKNFVGYYRQNPNRRLDNVSPLPKGTDIKTGISENDGCQGEPNGGTINKIIAELPK